MFQENKFTKIHYVFITWYNRPMWYLRDRISFFSFKREENFSLFFGRYFKKNNGKNDDKKKKSILIKRNGKTKTGSNWYSED